MTLCCDARPSPGSVVVVVVVVAAAAGEFMFLCWKPPVFRIKPPKRVLRVVPVDYSDYSAPLPNKIQCWTKCCKRALF